MPIFHRLSLRKDLPLEEFHILIDPDLVTFPKMWLWIVKANFKDISQLVPSDQGDEWPCGEMGHYLRHSFWRRLLQIIQMLSLIDNAAHAAVLLYWVAKVLNLPIRNYEIGEGPNGIHIDTDLEMALMEIFHGPPEHWLKRSRHGVVATYCERTVWVDAASACEELREYMSEYFDCPAHTHEPREEGYNYNAEKDHHQ